MRRKMVGIVAGLIVFGLVGSVQAADLYKGASRAEKMDQALYRESIISNQSDSQKQDFLQKPEINERRMLADERLLDMHLGTEGYYYRYAEPGLMRDKGYLFGIFGGLTYRTSENEHIKHWRDIISDVNKINMFRVEGRFSLGQVDYESEGTGKIDDLDYYNFEIRGLLGYDIPVLNASRITPYAGFGYRYLLDDSGGMISTTGHFGYDRESNYYYLPIGFEFYTESESQWAFELTVEYDVFLSGKQKSHFEDGGTGWDTLTNDQDDGQGARGSIKIIKKGVDGDFFVEPFIRYWDIEKSDTRNITGGGTPVGFVGTEPKNNTREVGLRIGGRF